VAIEHWLELGLIGLPLAGAIVVACAGIRRVELVKAISAGVAVLTTMRMSRMPPAVMAVTLARWRSRSRHDSQLAMRAQMWFSPGRVTTLILYSRRQRY